MTGLDQVLSADVVHRLGWTLLHSLWQGGLVAGALAFLLFIIPNTKPNGRYVASCLSLLTILVLCGATFCMVETPAPSVEPPSAVANPVASEPPVRSEAPFTVTPSTDASYSGMEQPHPGVDAPSSISSSSVRAEPWGHRIMGFAQPLLPWFVLLWLLGVFGLSIWHLGGWIAMYRLRRIGTSPVTSEVTALVKHLSERLRVSRPVRVLQSVLIQTPAVIGHFRPIILMPLSALTGLSSEQIEAIIAHELAHIRRYDYLVSLLQTVVETLLFHHPAAWWISHRIRIEREYCCDDLALSVAQNRANYAQALGKMAELHGSGVQLAVAASGGSILGRIHRLIGTPSRHVSHAARCFAGAVSIGAVVGLAICLHLAACASDLTNGAPPAATEPATAANQLPWGKPVDGMQVRLRATKSRWNEGSGARLWATMRNQGTRNLLVHAWGQSCELEVDGRWYRRPLNTHGIRPLPKPFPPGRQYDNIAVDLDQWWELASSQNAGRPGMSEPEKLKLTAGKHTICVAFTATAAKNEPGKHARAVSNSVAIEIISAKEIAARPGQLKSQKNAFELRLAYHGPGDNPNQSGVETPFRSLIIHTTLMRYDLPGSWSAVSISEDQAARIVDHLQVDGSLADALPFTDDRPPPDLDGPAYSLTVKGPENLVLYKPLGWGLTVLDFLERLRTVLDGDAAETLDRLMAVLGPQRQQWEGVAKWGQAVEGVQVRLRAKQSKWKLGTALQFSADVRNLGTRNLLVYRAARFWTSSELEIDGRWYRRRLPKHNYRPPLSDLVPGRQFDNILVDLSRGWYPVASPSQDAGGTGVTRSEPGRLKLAPGKHTIRVAPTMPVSGNRPGDHVRAVSNPIEIEIVAKRDEKVGASGDGNADVGDPASAVEATGARRDNQTTSVRPVGGPTLDGKEILTKLKSFDAVYAAAFTASGNRPGWPKKKWKLTMLDGEIVYEEQVVEIPEPAEDRMGRFIAFRRTFYVGPKVQAEHDWVGRIRRYGPLDPWPEKSPGPATGGSLKVVRPDASTYMLLINRPLLCLGRGYSKYITDIKEVVKQEDGRLKITADGIDIGSRPGATWEVVVDPDAAYMVCSGKLADNKKRVSSFANSGLKKYDARCVPEKAECKGAFINASFEIQSASPEADFELLKRAKAAMRPPYLIHTDVHDGRVSPELYVAYDAGKESPQGGKPDWDLDLENPKQPATQWGEPVDGVQCRLRAEKTIWQSGKWPKFRADLRNHGKCRLSLAVAPESWEIELDGVWYHATVHFLGLVRKLSLLPGEQQTDISLGLTEPSEWRSKEENKPLPFKPGKHTVRFALRLSPADGGPPSVSVVSNPVEITIERALPGS